MYVHGDNLIRKENHKIKYQDPDSRKYLGEIRASYNTWQKENEKLKGPYKDFSEEDDNILKGRTELLSNYKDFLDQKKYAEKFDSRSNLHSSVLEEFMYYLFRDLVLDFSDSALIGKSRTFKDIFFMAQKYEDLVKRPNVKIETKDHDFAIGTNIETKMNTAGSKSVKEVTLQVPVVAIECKTYLDKTMLEGASTDAEQLKIRSPNAISLVVAEWLKLTDEVNPKKFKVDQIYVLRKQKNTDREFRFLPEYQKNPICLDVVKLLYNLVRDHLTMDWKTGIQHGLERGYLI